MISLDAQLLPRSEEVAAKVIDGEAIIINLVNGSYYSMDGVGAMIWELIEQGHTLEDIAGFVIGSYEVAEDTVRADLEVLSGELLQESLVSLGDGSAAASPLTAVESDELAPYAAPRLVKYTDMADLLALDPPMPGLADNPWLENVDE